MSKAKLETGLFTTSPPNQLLQEELLFSFPPCHFFKGNWKEKTPFLFNNYRNSFSQSQKENFLIIMNGYIFAPIILDDDVFFLTFAVVSLHLVIF